MIKFRHTLKIALSGLWTNKRRSSLTILGIVIGIVAIMLILSLGKGAQELIIGQVQGIGSTTIAIIPGRKPQGPSDLVQVLQDSLTIRDLNLLKQKQNLPSAKSVMPVVFGSESIAYENETYQATIFGGTKQVASMFNLVPVAGVFFSDEEVKSNATEVVLGATVKDELFGLSQAVGEKVRIKGKNYRVVGVLPEKGQGSIFNFDKMIFIPYRTAQLYVLGIKYFNRIIVMVNNEADVPSAIDDIERTLRNSHNIDDPKKDDFFVSTASNAIDSISVITDAMTYFLVAVAGISLIVGGFGIMTIMLVSVTERTKEIGLRKAVGATDYDILYQFLLEAVLLTMSGGIIGVVLGALFMVAISVLLSSFLGLYWAYTFPIGGALLGISVSVLVGVFFGLYPARKASKRSPMDAMRYE